MEEEWLLLKRLNKEPKRAVRAAKVKMACM